MTKRINLYLQVVFESLLLLIITLGILAYFSHQALRHEALLNAHQTMEGTVQEVDNILLSVEQSTGNIYYDMLEHLNDPDRMFTYCRELVKSNPNIMGCAIAFKPGYYPDRGHFMAYVHRSLPAEDGSTTLITSDSFTDRPYTEQRWYSDPMKSGEVGWIDPLKGHETEAEPLVTFCLPFNDKYGKRVGVMAVDVSLNQLSKIILETKPSENGYTLLLAHNGSYIVHPDKNKLTDPHIFSHTEQNDDPAETAAAKAMVAGESGMREFTRDGQDWCIFFRPFERFEWEGRATGDIGWSVGVVYPEKDIFGMHNILITLVIGISVAGMLLFYVLCRWMMNKQLRPLKRLTKQARLIADGNYKEHLSPSIRKDEIGLLQNRFCDMQHSLQEQVEELEDSATQLQRHGETLRAAYEKTIEADKIKTSFMHYITKQMAQPAECIDSHVVNLCTNYHNISKKERTRQVDYIQRKCETIMELLNHMEHFTENNAGKEANNE